MKWANDFKSKPPPPANRRTIMAASNMPSDLGSLLAAVLKEKDWQRRLRLHQVFLFWEEVVGNEIARHAQPQVIKGDVLWLEVSDSIWMQQLQFERFHLLELLNARLAAGGHAAAAVGEGMPLRLSDLKFKLGPSHGRRQPVRPPKPCLHEIDHDRFAQFSASLNSIADQGLKESMKRLWLAMQRAAGGR